MRDLSVEICEYINKMWVAPWEGSARSLADDLDIDEKTLRQIKNHNKKPYKISLYSLEKISNSKDLTLEKFFMLIGR